MAEIKAIMQLSMYDVILIQLLIITLCYMVILNDKIFSQLMCVFIYCTEIWVGRLLDMKVHREKSIAVNKG